MLQIFLLRTADFSAKIQKEYEKLLSAEERVRLANTKLVKNKKNFIFGRVLIRIFGAKYLNCKAQELVFNKNNNGRLEIKRPVSNLSFNISHSNEMVVLALSNSKVGVDVEFMKKRNFCEIADYFFTKKEAAIINNIDANEFPTSQKRAFYNHWTFQEAFVKCNGDSIFDVKNRSIDYGEYQSFSFLIDEFYMASLVIKGNVFPANITFCQATPEALTGKMK